MNSLNYRQIHLDFHTSEKIHDIGSKFNKKQFQKSLEIGHANSVTVFSKCHHGWAYHPSEANEIHPNLTFDLLGEMIEAAHEIGVKTPVYISAGLDEKTARRHPEWLSREKDESIVMTSNFNKPGYHLFCLNSPYLEILLSQVEEVVKKYDADGIFLDIVSAHPCYCQTCVNQMLDEGLNPYDIEDNIKLSERVYENYTTRVRDVIDKYNKELPVFHNGGHIVKGRHDLAQMNTHLELESLPTGGWGYDHFPMSAKYAIHEKMEFLGMTGKFHNTWGEFGGFKHPNALIYETSLSIALGAKCSIGDQLHPYGEMDLTTYETIGEAYRRIEEKEPWCKEANAKNDIAVLSMESMECYLTINRDSSYLMDLGASRMMLQGHYLYDIIDRHMNFSNYQLIIFPDSIRFDAELAKKVTKYIDSGGKVLLTGESGMSLERNEFVIDIGVNWKEKCRNRPNYFRPKFDTETFRKTSFVMYEESEIVEVTKGKIFGDMEASFFNRSIFDFCSHQHTPSSMESVAPGMVITPKSVYIPWKIFTDYANQGELHMREFVSYAIDTLLGSEKVLRTNLPTQGIVSLMEQRALNRDILHLVYAAPVMKGYGNFTKKPLSVIEDLIPIYDTDITLKVDKIVTRVVLVPELVDIPFELKDNQLKFNVTKFVCHQMINIEYK